MAFKVKIDQRDAVVSYFYEYGTEWILNAVTEWIMNTVTIIWPKIAVKDETLSVKTLCVFISYLIYIVCNTSDLQNLPLRVLFVIFSWNGVDDIDNKSQKKIQYSNLSNLLSLRKAVQ